MTNKTLILLTLFLITFSCGQEMKKKSIKSANSINIKIIQLKKSRESGCYSEIKISKGSKTINSLQFDNIESLGGNSGLYMYEEKINNNTIISKFGDYDGRTIIINKNGEIHNIIGGNIYFDKKNSLLISKYDSDLNGFSVFDIKNEKLIMEMKDIPDVPIDFYRDNTNRLFFTAKSDESDDILIWEIEIEMDRIMEVDIKKEYLSNFKLKQLGNIDGKLLNCE